MTIKVDIEQGTTVTVELNAKRTLDGNIMIFDHEDIDIVLIEDKNKCLTFPKGSATDRVYSSQDRLFRFMVRRGVIDPSSIQGGNIYGSMEASILASRIPGVDSVQATLFALYEYIKEEKPYFATSRDYDVDSLDKLVRPKDSDSTDLGDVPHAATKGSLDMRVRPYGYRYNYSLLREDENNTK